MIAERVQQYLKTADLNAVSLESLAREFCMSERTLRRKLRAEGWHYLRLVRRERIARMRAAATETVPDKYFMAEFCGYTTPANFYRAFKDLMGCGYLQYKQQFSAGIRQ